MTDSQKIFVGPSNASWWKFKLAGFVWKVTRQNPIPHVAYVPGVKKAALWAFKVRVLSRDIEVTSEGPE